MRLTFKWFQRLCLVQFLLMLTLTWVAGILFEKKRGGGGRMEAILIGGIGPSKNHGLASLPELDLLISGYLSSIAN